MKTVLLAPQFLHAHWPWLKDNLLRVKEHTPDSWIPEDVYSAIKTGQAQALIGYEGQDAQSAPMAAAIVRVDKDQTGAPILFVWAAWMKGGDFAEALDYVKDCAKTAQCGKIRFESARPGWIKRAKLVNALFEMEV